MPRDIAVASDEPISDFDICDTFLSHTDKRGIIEFGNDTFVRLSGYSREELVGAPHRIVRHPDMPKAIYRIFWDHLKNEKTFCGYVKNRAKDGRHYWVVAVAVPTETGYLSIRFKPSSPEFSVMQTIYADLLEMEREGAAIQEGVAKLEAKIKERGFRDYRAFMGFMLATELMSRSKEQGIEPDESIMEFEKMGAQLTELSNGLKAVKSHFEGIKNSPVNLSVISAKLSKGREPMQALASNYSLLMDELVIAIKKLEASLPPVVDATYEGRVQHCGAVLYREVVRKFAEGDDHVRSDNHHDETRLLSAALRSFEASARTSCDGLASEVAGFSSVGHHLRRLLSGLATSRIVCEIEAASLIEYTASISEISAQLGQCQQDLDLPLDRILGVCSAMSRSLPGAKRRN